MDNRKRYQIFVSSTFADLKEERKMVMQAILERKGFPAGMELFPAKDKKQFDYIKQVIDDSDYYLLIIGARYGSLDDDGVSYTEKEYDYTVSKKIPVIAFLHRDIKSIPLGKADVDKELQQKLEAFRAKVQTGRLVNYWENPHDLKAKVISSLIDAFDDQDWPRIGWVRANSIANADSQKEIDGLQKEIFEYQNEVKRFETKVESLEANLSKKEGDILALDSSYQAALQEIENLNEQIKKFKTESEKLKPSSVTIVTTPQVRTEVITIPGTNVTFRMVYVKGGKFTMGAAFDDKEAEDDEKPAHAVTLSDYWIGETQVTQELWRAVMGKNPSDFKGPLNPVENVSWIDCQKFIERLNNKTGRNFRLPTEAQWEFAARGGFFSNEMTRYKFSGMNYDLEAIAWYNNHWINTFFNGKTHPVAQLYPNQLGLYDMSGNVWEWCQDWYDSNFYRVSPMNEPKGPTSGIFRVCRGGSWESLAKSCRVSCRNNQSPEFGSYTLGLRLAL